MPDDAMEVISAKQVVFDDKRTLEEVIRDLISKIEPAEAVTEVGESNE